MAMDKIEDESASTVTTADDHVVPVFSEGLLEGQDEAEDDTIFIDEVEELQPSKASVHTEKPPRAGIVMLFCLLLISVVLKTEHLPLSEVGFVLWRLSLCLVSF